MASKSEGSERLQVFIALSELKAIDDFRFRHRMPNRSAAVRELLRRGLAASNQRANEVKRTRK
jgi:hypothetical protein